MVGGVFFWGGGPRNNAKEKLRVGGESKTKAKKRFPLGLPGTGLVGKKTTPKHGGGEEKRSVFHCGGQKVATKKSVHPANQRMGNKKKGGGGGGA